MKTLKLLLVSSVIFSSALALAQSTPSGFDIARCTKCHSDDSVNKQLEFPRLEAQTPEYIKTVMKAYVAGKRHNFGAERYMTKRLNYLKLSQATVDQLADYFSKLPMTKLTVNSDAAKVAAGKEIYANSCAMCHGDNAEGMGINPRLAGQYKSFLSEQIKAYQAGRIENQNDMSDMAKTLSDSDLDAVTTYLQSL
jgi:cytochrome c553